MELSNQSEPSALPNTVSSPVRKIAREAIKPSVVLQLFAQSGGYCQFDGCEQSILEHHLTKVAGTVGEKAHIVAYSRGGPRSDQSLPLDYINSIDNLMLLCRGCHKHIDEHEALYPRSRLEAMKAARIALIENAVKIRAEELKTHVLVLEAPIGGRAVSIKRHETVSAIRPRYPALSNPLRITLNGAAPLGESQSFYAAAAEQIEAQMRSFCREGGELASAARISVFALAPIPLLVKFGASLPDKTRIDVHHLRNNPSTWDWGELGEVKRFALRKVHEGARGSAVVLGLSLSGAVDFSLLGEDVARDACLYELHVVGEPPTRTLLQTAADLDAFKAAYCSALGEIAGEHGVASPIHLLLATPASAAVVCGLMRHPKAQGALRIYDLRDGVYQFVLEIGR